MKKDVEPGFVNTKAVMLTDSMVEWRDLPC